MPNSKPKVFLSYAYEDKLPFVQNLYEALNGPIEVWFDDRSIQVGESLPFAISDGAKNCEWGIEWLPSRNTFQFGVIEASAEQKAQEWNGIPIHFAEGIQA